jgi:hypothetical protein
MKKSVIAAIIVIMVVSVASSGYYAESAANQNSPEQQTYASAVVLFEAGSVDQAYALFKNQLAGYRDSDLYVKYINALRLADDEMWSPAAMVFGDESLVGFLDADSYTSYCWARYHESEGEIDDALFWYDLLQGYNKSGFLDSLTRASVLRIINKLSLSSTATSAPAPTSTPAPTYTPAPTSTPAPSPIPTRVPYIGLAKVERHNNRAYTEVRASASGGANALFIVHYGERYLCTGMSNGWYEIETLYGETGYLPPEHVSLLPYDANEITLSDANFPWIGGFTVELTQKATAFSQPKSSAQSKRYNADGSSTTFYFRRGLTLTCIAKTTRENKTWYMLLDETDGVPEISWIEGANCEVKSGDEDYTIIPASWYD